MAEKEVVKTKPTFILSSEQPLSVMAGGGDDGFRCVVVFEADSDPKEKNIGINYADVARIVVDNNTVWVNYNLLDAPDDRQDITETGIVELELFDSSALREGIDSISDSFEAYGLAIQE